MNREHLEKAAVFSLFLLAAFPKILSFTGEVIDTFAYSSEGIAQASVIKGTILVQPTLSKGGTRQDQVNVISSRTGITALLVIINQITGLPLETIIFLPIIGIALLPISYVFARNFSKSKLIALAYMIFLAYDPRLNTVTSNLYYISLGWIMFMTFLTVHFTFNDQKRKTSRLIVPVMFVIFLTAFASYYTAEGTIIFFAITMVILCFLKKKEKRFQLLALSFFAIFVAFDPMFTAYVKRFSLQKLVDFIGGYMRYLVSNLGFGASSEGAIRAYPGSRLAFYVDAISLAIIVFPVILFAVVNLVRPLRWFSNKGINSIAVYAFVMSGIFDGVLYLTRGHFSFTVIIFLFPLLLFCMINGSLGNRKIGIAVFFVLLMLGPIRFLAYWNDPSRPYGDDFYSKSAPGLLWLSQSSVPSNVITSSTIAGQLMTYLMTNNRTNDVWVFVLNENDLTPLYSGNYSEIRQRFAERKYSYLILSTEYVNHILSSTEWKTWPPLGTRLSLISDYAAFDMVYCDGRTLVYFLAVPK